MKSERHNRNHYAWVISILFILMFNTAVCAQSSEVMPGVYTLVAAEENQIRNTIHLEPFFEKLHALKISGKGKINIVHIGDSHIQADLMTEVVRKNLQREFGNAGRGLIIPGNVAGTNEPLNIRTSSTDKWQAKRCIHVTQPLPIGISGITLNTEQAGAKINIRMNDPLCDYSFNTVTLFYQKDRNSFTFSIQDSASAELALIEPATADSSLNYSRFVLPALLNAITIQTMRPNEEQRYATLFGLNLENSRDGILYHAIGVNGAKYSHYNAARYFAQQTQVLNPDLFIISLGTNESVEYPYLDKNFYRHVDKLVQALSTYNPQASFMLISPPDAFQKRVRPNPGIEQVRNQIIQYAVENGLGFWDMYKVNGGKNSAVEWKMQGLLRPDGIHFTKDGYAYQGNLLYEAIMKSYNQYVSVRYP